MTLGREKKDASLEFVKEWAATSPNFFLGTFTYIDIDGMQNFDLTHKNYDE